VLSDALIKYNDEFRRRAGRNPGAAVAKVSANGHLSGVERASRQKTYEGPMNLNPSYNGREKRGGRPEHGRAPTARKGGKGGRLAQEDLKIGGLRLWPKRKTYCGD